MFNGLESLTQIRELNLAYLLLARRLLEEDRVAAMYRLNLSASLAEILSALTPAQTRRIADSSELIWHLRLDKLTVLSSLIEGDRHAPLHAAIVLAEEPCSRMS
ncbi:flagellar transcriptional regulator FlhD [Caballeronia sp. BR00000012568055]|jgi:flagellar transcriptional activator FlhD|uniref:flagellar transcriptional regulator FlhD n=1 Tax=Caballeronia sp. BR00000012568055 TaxID=2918761 RepID=UPI0023F7AFF2|nr:flagellar transcriptional regulator FlhD [Caballeronia sp. BR00000012568055]